MSTINYEQDKNKVSACVPSANLRRYCKYCGIPIRWKCLEKEKIINSVSIYHWEIKRTRQWIALDFSTGKNIVTGLQRRRLGNEVI
jgi:hypothetical protein